MLFLRPRRRLRSIGRRYREARLFGMGMRSGRHPVLAHIVPIRRCNLSCAYCNEYDDYSAPVPLDEMKGRIDRLADLGTTIITISGGEPLLHPDLERIVGHIRSRGIVATMITNGLLLTPARIDSLNRSGLDRLQISIDNLAPDETSKKSLKALDSRLRLLAQRALFEVDVNAVIGASSNNPEDSWIIARRAGDLGFHFTLGLLHDSHGQLQPLPEAQQAVLDKILKTRRSTFSADRWNIFQANLARGLPNEWHCPAGGRYLYVCEEGKVHWCSQQRGRPALPLSSYTEGDLEREAGIPKSCAPYCTVGCVHRVAMLDELRRNPRAALERWLSVEQTDKGPAPLPRPVKALFWMFLGRKESLRRRLMISAALRILRLR